MMKTIIDKEDNRIQPFTEEFLALCKKYNVGIEGGDPWYGIELVELDNFDLYAEGVRESYFTHILRNVEETENNIK